MRSIALMLILLATPGSTGSGVQVFLDDQHVGILGGQGIVYDTGANTIHVYTSGGTFGCQQDRVFKDRFQGGLK